MWAFLDRFLTEHARQVACSRVTVEMLGIPPWGIR